MQLKKWLGVGQGQSVDLHANIKDYMLFSFVSLAEI